MQPTRSKSVMSKLLCCALAAILLGACGGGGGDNDDGGSSSLRPLEPGDPAFGVAGQALISDRGLTANREVRQIWIGFATTGQWQAFVSALDHATASNAAPWVGGDVIADASRPLGFYFDPETTVGAEVVVDSLQTPLFGLANDPQGAEAAGHSWYVPGIVEQLIPGPESTAPRTR